MKTKIFGMACVAISIFALTPFAVISEEAAKEADLEIQAMAIVKRFGGTLKPQLKKAIQSGGLSHAVNTCATLAPQIAKDLSLETGWKIKRVSLKPRNAKSANADPFEQKILKQFEARQAKGESAKTMSYSATIDNQFRFMKAQGVEGICLSCHGQTISAPLKSSLKKYYPDDTATGYSLGQIRGAFSLVKILGKNNSGT